MRHFTLFLCLALTLGACVGSPPDDATGAAIFSQTCSRCHGADLGGGVGPALGEGSYSATQPDEFLIRAITEGRGRMPSFAATLTEDQISRVVAYLRQVQDTTP